MELKKWIFSLAAAVSSLIYTSSLSADTIHVAVASNFAAPMKIISQKFEKISGHTVILMSGSTGKHYAQIKNGAPVDLFFSADVHSPRLLESQHLAIAGTRFTYAVGKLVLWSPQKIHIDPKGKILKQNSFHHLAIANPKLAPYGKAAKQVLVAMGLWNKQLKEKLVQGENISQTFQYIRSGNAEIGFVAASQLRFPDNENPEQLIRIKGTFWLVPDPMHDPIEQQAVMIRDSEPGQTFLKYFSTEETKRIIRYFGYDTP